MGNNYNAFANRRRAPREAVMLAGSAMSVTRSRSVVVADVSPRGARLGGRDLPELEAGDSMLHEGRADETGAVPGADLCRRFVENLRQRREGKEPPRAFSVGGKAEGLEECLLAGDKRCGGANSGDGGVALGCEGQAGATDDEEVDAVTGSAADDASA